MAEWVLARNRVFGKRLNFWAAAWIPVVSVALLVMTGLPLLAASQPPTILEIPDQVTLEDTPLVVDFTVDDDYGTGDDNLTITAQSNRQQLVPDANIVVGGIGASRILTMTPAQDAWGSVSIAVMVEDQHDNFALESFSLTITPVNDPPTITLHASPEQTTPEGTQTGQIDFVVGDVETPATALTVTASSSNQPLVPDQNIQLDGSGVDRWATVQLSGTLTGTAVITLTVDDGEL